VLTMTCAHGPRLYRALARHAHYAVAAALGRSEPTARRPRAPIRYTWCVEAQSSLSIGGLIRSGSTYLLANLAVQASSLVTFPLYARCLGPSGYGTLALLLAFTNVLTTVLALGLNTAIIKFAAGDTQEDARAVWTAVTYVALSAVVLIPLAAGFREPLLGFIAPSVSGSASWLIPLAVAYVAVAATLLMLLAQATAENRARLYLAGSVANALCSLTVAVLLVGVSHMGVGGALIALITGSVSAILLVAPKVLRRESAAVSARLLLSMTAFGIGLLPMNLAAWALDLADRYVLSHFVSMAEVGQYSAAYRVGSLIIVGLVAPFRTAFVPFLFRIGKRPNGPNVIAQVTRLFVITSLVCALVVSVFVPELLRLLAGPRFVSVSEIVIWVAAGSVLVGLTTPFSAGIMLCNKTYLGALSFGVAAACNIGLNLFLIPPYGIRGAAIATLLSDLLLALLFVGTSERLYRTPLEGRRILVCLLWLALAALLSMPMATTAAHSVVVVLCKLAIIVAFAAACIFGGGLTKAERNTMFLQLIRIQRIGAGKILRMLRPRSTT